MSQPQFYPGQRWVSNTESELGLGIVDEIQGRRVSLVFPAAAEQRTYAVDNAPLSRIEYPVGETIVSNEGVQLQISDQMQHNGCLIYIGDDTDGATHHLHEIDLDSFVRFSQPQDRLFAGQVDRDSAFQLRLDTLTFRHRHQQSAAYGLIGPRVQLLPHQLYIASQVAARHAPRVLLADEVGLGKTIEAGLILHQQLTCGRAERVLIIVPDSLVHQWLVEMLRRFNLAFTILDTERCEALQERSDDTLDSAPLINPFETTQRALCSLSFMTDNPQYRQMAVAAGWDLLVVDEAHHLHWSLDHSSPEYDCIDELGSSIPGLLLLTATPEQLGIESHFARMRLLDPDRYYDLQTFIDEEAAYRPVSDLVQQLLGDDAATQLQPQSPLWQQLAGYLGDDAMADLVIAFDKGEPKPAIEHAVHQLLDLHGTGRVLFRNTRDAVSGFPERHLQSHPLTAPEAYLSGVDSADLNDALHPERLLGPSWTSIDPRVSWLGDWLDRHPDEKALIICHSATTAQALEEHLRLRVGIRTAVFHEGLSLIARDRAAAYFADEDLSAQTLICSEIGSEGRNFQFAHHLVLFDLPLNPDLLEQRIGRLDRIGQQHPVQIHSPVYQASAMQRLQRWFHEGINAFESPCAAGFSLYQSHHEALHTALLSADDSGLLEPLLTQSRAAAQQAEASQQAGRNRLLELNSCNPRHAAEVVQSVSHATGSLELASYMERVFDEFGVEQQSHGSQSWLIEPGNHMLCPSFPGLSNDGMTATFQRNLALSRDDMHFLSWEHPMVAGAMEMIADGEWGNTAVSSLKLPPLKPGTLLLETIFTLHCPAPRSLQLNRYLPAAMVRVVVDANGMDLSQVLPADKLAPLLKRTPRGTANQVVRHARESIQQLIGIAQQKAHLQLPPLLAEAKKRLAAESHDELERLRALALANPNIRADEIHYLEQSSAAAVEHLTHAQLQLDALRVIVAM